MNLTVNRISKLINGKVSGNGETIISGAASLSDAESSDISFLKDASKTKIVKEFSTTKAGAVIVPEGIESNGKTVIKVSNPLMSFAKILSVLQEEKKSTKSGVDPLASVAPTAKLGKNVTIGPFCVIEDLAEIGDDVVLQGQIYIGERSKIGKGGVFYPQVVVREDITIGENCIVHAGAVIGSDGYGYYFDQGKHNKIPQIGTVVIGNNVEIGSGTTIDRATTGATRIGDGTKIDNLVQVAHNVEIGEHSLLVAQVGIGGSCKIGKGVVMGGQSGVADHVNIGDRAQIAGKTGVIKDVSTGEMMFGTPAQPIKDSLRQSLLIRMLPDLFQEIKKIKKIVIK